MTAYGWFLLAICQGRGTWPYGASQLQRAACHARGQGVPGRDQRVPPTRGGRLAGRYAARARARSPRCQTAGQSAVATGELPGSEQLERWLVALEALFERMGDSLDEY